MLTNRETQIDLPKGFESVLLNEGGHGFYRVQYTPDLLAPLLRQMPEGLAPIERFNLVNDMWAAAIAGLIPLIDYLDLTATFRADRDKNVWAILIDSFHTLNRIIDPGDRPGLEAFVRDRVAPAFADLGWTPRPNESELTRQLRGELLRALGTIGNDRAVQEKAEELYARPESVDPNLLPSIIAILAYAGDAARYQEYVQRFKAAPTPQEERRYLYALPLFRPPALIEKTLAKSLNGEIRTQDAPFIVRMLLTSAHGRELA
ncbi:MAG: hypothetical protein C4294_02275, partial [Nitrospiraceae bacterium]